MKRQIRKVAVLGSGVMGAGIAAHLANVGIDVLLLDRVPEDESQSKPPNRNQFAESALSQLTKPKPSPVYTKASLDKIRAGNFEDHLPLLAQMDWVIEVVVENLAIKKELLAKVEQHWRPGTIVSSNTSGISIKRIAEDCNEEFQAHFLGTHFFNPPRYMKLLEIIPTPATSPEILSFMKQFSESVLGKGVVIAKDTPNFIANRIGVYGLMVTLEEMNKRELTISDVDQLTGPVMGRPKSATFRTLDLVGLDTFIHVAKNVHDHVSDANEKHAFQIPEILKYLVSKGNLGEKSGKGFYLKKGKEIYQLDLLSKEYGLAGKSTFPCLQQAKNSKKLSDKLRTIAYAGDEGGQFVWSVLKKTLLYSAAKIPEIADDILSIDQAMKWGFNWELGPFETWDAIGLEKSLQRMKAEGETIPPWIEKMVSNGITHFYQQQAGQSLYVHIDGTWKEAQRSDKSISLHGLKEQGKLIKKNSGASLIDLGDGVACLEFHSMNNALGQDILQMIRFSLEEVRKNYLGLVIGNQSKNFCVGANLMMLLMEAQDENWFEIDQLVRQFQQIAMDMKYFEKPIVSAPYAMTLGGGVEMCLPAARVQAAAETYLGLVEVGVGLIPAGAGTKEMLLRATHLVDVDGKVDLQPYVNRVFETIAMAKVSTSGEEARELGYLRSTDTISVNQDFQLYDAKQQVISLSTGGYSSPKERKVRVVGEPGLAVMRLGIYQMKSGGYISDHDEKIAGKLATILSGGSVPAGTMVSEQYLLDLEREAFISLCGEPKTQARMQHMLLKGKPLRN